MTNSNSIDYSAWFGLKALIAKSCDKDQNGKLEKTDKFDEISIFNAKYKEAILQEKDYHVAKQDGISEYTPQVKEHKESTGEVDPEIASKIKDAYAGSIEMSYVNNMINNEAQKRGVSLEDIDTNYWAEKIFSVAREYGVPAALLVSIIGQETNGKFTKNENSKNGAGHMQITQITVADFFPKAEGNWNNIYKQMNEDLLNDILYKKDKNGNFIKDRKGDYVLKYPTPKALRDACAKDDELGIKVGLLCFEMKYVKAVAQKKYGKATYANIPKVIDGIQAGEITLSENENKNAIKTALKNYNSVFQSYAATIVDSLEQHGLEFKDLYFIK